MTLKQRYACIGGISAAVLTGFLWSLYFGTFVFTPVEEAVDFPKMLSFFAFFFVGAVLVLGTTLLGIKTGMVIYESRNSRS